VRFEVRLTDDAEADLRDIFDFISSQASVARAQAYVNRIIGFLAGLEMFPERGTVREESSPDCALSASNAARPSPSW
jgi:plasmid stabilization system protein ParE